VRGSGTPWTFPRVGADADVPRTAPVGYARRMKTFTIELQRIKALSNSHGLIRARVDATVQTAPERDDDGGAPSSTLTLTVENARVLLLLLLKAQLAEVDSRKARSQR
jgi:hypothetical protein